MVATMTDPGNNSISITAPKSGAVYRSRSSSQISVGPSWRNGSRARIRAGRGGEPPNGARPVTVPPPPRPIGFSGTRGAHKQQHSPVFNHRAQLRRKGFVRVASDITERHPAFGANSSHPEDLEILNRVDRQWEPVRTEASRLADAAEQRRILCLDTQSGSYCFDGFGKSGIG